MLTNEELLRTWQSKAGHCTAMLYHSNETVFVRGVLPHNNQQQISQICVHQYVWVCVLSCSHAQQIAECLVELISVMLCRNTYLSH